MNININHYKPHRGDILIDALFLNVAPMGLAQTMTLIAFCYQNTAPMGLKNR